jgi:Meiotically up-regulated gene 113
MAVYMIRAGLAGDVKIGVAKDPLKRLGTLQTSSAAMLRLIRVLQGDAGVEKALHRRFSSGRKAGEWFAFVPEMLTEDLGHPDLPIPVAKRGERFDDTPRGRRRALHHDIIHALGGADMIARRIGVAPWVVVLADGISPWFLSAVALMMRDAGYRHVTGALLLELKNAEHEQAENERQEARDRVAARDAADADSRTAHAESLWILKNGVGAAWWELRPENRPPLAANDDDAANTPTAAGNAA